MKRRPRRCVLKVPITERWLPGADPWPPQSADLAHLLDRLTQHDQAWRPDAEAPSFRASIVYLPPGEVRRCLLAAKHWPVAEAWPLKG